MSFPAVAETAPTSGTCGENVTWSYDAEKKELTLSGSGATESYDKTEDRPFNGLSYQIYSIVIEPGVTSLGKNLFNYVAKSVLLVRANKVAGSAVLRDHHR